MMTTRSVNSIAQDLFDLIEENGFTNTSLRQDGWETEWTLTYPNGSSSTIEVFVSKQSIEILRGEFSKDDIQNGPKGTALLTNGITDAAMRLLRPLS